MGVHWSLVTLILEHVALSFGGGGINKMVQEIHIHQASEHGSEQFRGSPFLVTSGREGIHKFFMSNLSASLSVNHALKELESNVRVDIKFLLPPVHQVLWRAEDRDDIGKW